jgi:hypothetical protein
MPWVYPTKTCQNILLFQEIVIALKPLQTDLVNTYSLIDKPNLSYTCHFDSS